MSGRTLQFVRGGQIFMYTMKMMFQVLHRIFAWAVLGYVLVVGVILYVTSQADIKVYFYHLYSQILDLLGMGKDVVWHSGNFNLSAGDILSLPKLQYAYEQSKSSLFHNLVWSLISGGILYLGIVFVFYKFFLAKGEKYSRDKYVSGTRLAENVKETIKSVKSSKRGTSDICLFEKIPLPLRSENQGLLFHGSIGTGKSQAIMALLDQIRASGDAAIIYDKECTLKPYYFQKGIDVELNPVSELCENWDLWEECKNPLEIGSASQYLIPKSLQGSDPFWVDSARTILSSMAWKMADWDEKDCVMLLQLLLTTSLDDMRGLLVGTESENLVSKEIEKTAISIKSVMATYTKSLRFMEGLSKSGKKKFSIRNWVHEATKEENNNPGWLFITSRSQYHKEIKPLISLWLGLAMQSIQTLQKNENRRIWLVMDELASLHRLEMLSDTMADIRKFGGCVAIGVQSLSQIQYLYGNHEGDAINDLLNTKAFFRSPSSKVAKLASDDLGEQVIEAIKESQSYGPNSIRDGNTVGSQREVRKTIEPSDIMTLEDLTCYLKIVGDHPIAKIHSEYKSRNQIIDPLKERKINFDALEKLNSEALKAQNNPGVHDDVKAIRTFESEVDVKVDEILNERAKKKNQQQQIEEREAALNIETSKSRDEFC